MIYTNLKNHKFRINSFIDLGGAIIKFHVDGSIDVSYRVPVFILLEQGYEEMS